MQIIFKEIKLSFLELKFHVFYEDHKILMKSSNFPLMLKNCRGKTGRFRQLFEDFFIVFKPNWITDWRLSSIYKFSAWNRFYNNLTCKKCKSNGNQLSKFGLVNWIIIWVNLSRKYAHFKIMNIEYDLQLIFT